MFLHQVAGFPDLRQNHPKETQHTCGLVRVSQSLWFITCLFTRTDRPLTFKTLELDFLTLRTASNYIQILKANICLIINTPLETQPSK